MGDEMNKAVIKDIWGSYAAAARAIGVSRSTVSQWPNELTPRLQDRVIAAALRAGKRIPPEWLAPPKEKSA